MKISCGVRLPPHLLGPLLTSCVAELGEWAKIPTTYAGGARGTQTKLNCMASSNTVSRYFRSRPCWSSFRRTRRSNIWKVSFQRLSFLSLADERLPSSLDIFGGSQVSFEELVQKSGKNSAFLKASQWMSPKHTGNTLVLVPWIQKLHSSFTVVSATPKLAKKWQVLRKLC